MIGGLVGLNSSTGFISSSNFTGTVTAACDGSSVGGLVGTNSGNITGSYNSGTVSASGTTSASGNTTSVGGLVGTNSGTITTSYNSGNVSASGASSYLGGLVGTNNANGSTNNISSSYNGGDVTAYGATSTVGGLVGLNNGGIINSYSGLFATASTDTTTSSNVGGLVGANAGSISNCYTISPTRGTGNVGALVGQNSGSVASSFWSSEIAPSGQLWAGYNSGTVDTITTQGQTIANMMNSTTYAGWDIPNTWGIVNNESFPYLQWQYSSNTPLFISGMVGTVNDGTFVGAGSGITVDAAILNSGTTTYQLTATSTVADGFYYLAISIPSTNTSKSGSALLYVDSDPRDVTFKANSLQYFNSGSTLSNTNLTDNLLVINGTNYNGASNTVFGWVPGISTPVLYDYLAGTGFNNLPPASDLLFTATNYGPITISNPVSQSTPVSLEAFNFIVNGDLTVTGDVTINNSGNFFLIGQRTISANHLSHLWTVYSSRRERYHYCGREHNLYTGECLHSSRRRHHAGGRYRFYKLQRAECPAGRDHCARRTMVGIRPGYGDL